MHVSVPTGCKKTRFFSNGSYSVLMIALLQQRKFTVVCQDNSLFLFIPPGSLEV